MGVIKLVTYRNVALYTERLLKKKKKRCNVMCPVYLKWNGKFMESHLKELKKGNISVY